MIVRADMGRGLAHQTQTFHEHLNPDVTVVVDMSLVANNTLPADFDLYPGAIVTQWKGYTASFENPDALVVLAECDVVYTAETYYDERLPMRVKTVLHVNPEFFRSQPATRYWYPTSWLASTLPPGELVPTPVKDRDIVIAPPGGSRLLHVAGHHALGDRNGTAVMTGLIQRNKHQFRLASQDGLRIHPRVLQKTEIVGATEDRWAMYDGCAILVYPRRYGGQSLVVNEAMARGLAVLMGDCPPNLATWPIVPIPVRPGGQVRTPGGTLNMSMVLTQPLEDTITVLLNDEELLLKYQTESLLWAQDNSWSRQLPRIRSLLEDAAS